MTVGGFNAHLMRFLSIIILKPSWSIQTEINSYSYSAIYVSTTQVYVENMTIPINIHTKLDMKVSLWKLASAGKIGCFIVELN